MTWSQPIIIRECILKNRTYVSHHVKGYKWNEPNLTFKKQRKLWIITVFLCQRMLLFSVCCLLCYSVNWLHLTLIAYESGFAVYTYQHVIVMLDVAKWT